MEKNDTYFTELLARYFSGEATPEDIQLLSGWVQSDPARQQQFEEYRRTWDLLQEERVNAQVDVDAEWGRFRGTDVSRRSSLGGSRSRPYVAAFRIAALVVLLLVPAWFLYRYIAAPEQIHLAAEAGSLACNLPDGSVVTLNKGASIDYPEEFSGRTRQVNITGEACFEVSHDASKPFIVQTGNVRVEVLGTVFYVKAGSGEEHVSVILESGSVAAYFKGDSRNRVILEPGEAAEVSVPKHAIDKHPAGDPNALAWKTRYMVFENQPLGDIVTLLNEVYNTRIVLADQRLSGCRVTATFDRQSLEAVLNVLRATLGITVENTSRGIVISGKACD